MGVVIETRMRKTKTPGGSEMNLRKAGRLLVKKSA
jgi:hypothetical protein